MSEARQSPAPVSLSAFLRSRNQSVYAVLDAARSGAVRPLLQRSGERYASLFSGRLAEDLADQAPYLVQFSDTSDLLDALAEPVCEQAWGYFLVSAASFDALRTHLRKFLIVKREDGRELFFRFYDPRVIRSFLRLSTPGQAGDLLQNISGLVCPSGDASVVLVFRLAKGELLSSELVVARPWVSTAVS
ncbi:MAG: hypothetical protein JWM26_1430 [Betaproteobacteria bacterium]|nr:hypothetical protein [Betaproteobacteria bacterium]